MSVNRAGKGIREYWTPDSHKRLQFKSDSECKEAFRKFFQGGESARESAFPVCALLSGGLDSSGIVGMASRVLAKEGRSLITLSSIPMPEAQGRVTDEREYIELFRTIDNLEMHEVSAPECGPFDNLGELVKSASLASYSYQHFLYTAFVRMAREGNARVILDGDGGELSASTEVSGYMAELLLAGKWQSLVRQLRRYDPNQRVNPSTIKRQVLRPLFPYALLKLLNRHSRFKRLIEYPIRADFIQDVLGRDVDQIKDKIFQMLVEYPNHRKNMAQSILRERSDISQRSHAGFVDYQKARYCYPYLDKRVLEFGMAIDGRFKYRDGSSPCDWFGLGGGWLPKAVLERTSKAPISPDYQWRYQKGKATAESTLQDYVVAGKWNSLVDFEKAMFALKKEPSYNSANPMRVDYGSQFLVPYTMYLCYFLDKFASKNHPKGCAIMNDEMVLLNNPGVESRNNTLRQP